VIRVLVVDDHPMVRTGLRVFLSESSDVAVVGELSDGDSALTFVDREVPDVVLMDLSMPGVDGIAATRAIVAAHPQVKVVVLTTFVERERVLEAVDAGAVGYLLKDADPEELVRSIRAAARGESPFAPRAAQALLADRSERSSREAPAAMLTDREREVIRLVARGLANKEIARRLHRSPRTIEHQVSAVLDKLNVANRMEVVLRLRIEPWLLSARPRRRPTEIRYSIREIWVFTPTRSVGTTVLSAKFGLMGQSWASLRFLNVTEVQGPERCGRSASRTRARRLLHGQRQPDPRQRGRRPETPGRRPCRDGSWDADTTATRLRGRRRRHE
jgi:DNA-binding NarL/FixJ family response regulator